MAAECKPRRARPSHVLIADLGRPGAAAALWAAGHRGRADRDPRQQRRLRLLPAVHRPPTWTRDAELLQLNVTSLVELSRRFVDRARPEADRARVPAQRRLDRRVPVGTPVLRGLRRRRRRSSATSPRRCTTELAGTPISVTCVCPGGTHTDFHAQAGAGDYGWLANRSMMSAEAVAKRSPSARSASAGATVIPGLAQQAVVLGGPARPALGSRRGCPRASSASRAPGALPSRSSAA